MCQLLFWTKAPLNGLYACYRNIDKRAQCIEVPSFTLETSHKIPIRLFCVVWLFCLKVYNVFILHALKIKSV